MADDTHHEKREVGSPRRPWFLVGALLVLLALTGWRLYLAPAPARMVRVSGEVMGTTYTVKVVARTRAQQSEEARAAVTARVKRALDEVDAAMSTYKPESEVSRFNAGPAGQDVQLSAPMVEVMRTAMAVHDLSGGAFDVTVGPLIDRWGFGTTGELTVVPSDAEIDALREGLGHDKLAFDAVAGTLRKTTARLRIDLSAVAKGYGVDRVASDLLATGWSDFMVEVGGEVRVAGRTEVDRPWRLAVERPLATQRTVQEVVSLDGSHAMATSGDYRNFTVVNGVKYAHTIDPTTGRPVTHDLASISVIADTCARADALATALNVMGPDRGFELAEREGLAALFLVRNAASIEVRPTPAWLAFREDASP